VGAHREQGNKAVDERAINIIGKQNQIRSLVVDNVDEPCPDFLPHLNRGWIAGVDEEEGLYIGVQQLVEFSLRDLPLLTRVGVNKDYLQLVVFQFGTGPRRSCRLA
jgi:hypothetical protein